MAEPPQTPESSSSIDSEIDYEGIPVLGVGLKKTLRINTYEELHRYIVELTNVLEEIFELGF